MYNIIDILNEKYPDRNFEEKNNNIYCDGVNFHGDIKIINKDINSFYPGDILELIFRIIEISLLRLPTYKLIQKCREHKRKLNGS
jgi:hypothetical protein